jgi:hypothetical protein
MRIRVEIVERHKSGDVFAIDSVVCRVHRADAPVGVVVRVLCAHVRSSRRART